MERKGDSDSNHSRSPSNNSEEPEKEIGGTGDPKKNWDRPDSSITVIDSGIEENPEDLLPLRLQVKAGIQKKKKKKRIKKR